MATTAAFPGLAIPGSTYPNLLSATAARFRPPMVSRPMTVDRPEYRPFNRVKGLVGLTVLKNGSSYVTVENPSNEDIQNATAAYLGGHEYEVDAMEASALTAAGYEVITQ